MIMKKTIVFLLLILPAVFFISCEDDSGDDDDDSGFDLAGIWDYSGDTTQYESVMTINDTVSEFFEETTRYNGNPLYYTNTFAVDEEDKVNHTYLLRVTAASSGSGLNVGEVIYCSYAVDADNLIRIYLNEC